MRRASSAVTSSTTTSSTSRQRCQQQQRQRSHSTTAPPATSHPHHASHQSRGSMSFLKGLRRAHLMRRKTLDANNSRITQPLMEGTQTTSITMQPTEPNPNDYCLMKETTAAVEDRVEVQQIVDISTATTSNPHTSTIFYSTQATTTATTTPSIMSQQTTTALVTLTTSSAINCAATPAAAIQLNSAISSLTNPLETLAVIRETTSTNVSANKTTNANHQITAPPPAVKATATTKTASFTRSDCLFNLATSSSTRDANSFSLHDLKQIDEAL